MLPLRGYTTFCTLQGPHAGGASNSRLGSGSVPGGGQIRLRSQLRRMRTRLPAPGSQTGSAAPAPPAPGYPGPFQPLPTLPGVEFFHYKDRPGQLQLCLFAFCSPLVPGGLQLYAVGEPAYPVRQRRGILGGPVSLQEFLGFGGPGSHPGGLQDELGFLRPRALSCRPWRP